jgi:hypothetical protein
LHTPRLAGKIGIAAIACCSYIIASQTPVRHAFQPDIFKADLWSAGVRLESLTYGGMDWATKPWRLTMFSLIRGVLFLLVCLIAIGLFRGWFSFSDPVHDAANDKVSLSISVDTKKVEADIANVKQKIAERVGDRVAERVPIVENSTATPAPLPR